MEKDYHQKIPPSIW